MSAATIDDELDAVPSLEELGTVVVSLASGKVPVVLGFLSARSSSD